MGEPIHILYIDDSSYDRALVREALKREAGAFELTEAETRDEFLQFLDQGRYDLVLSDFNILGFDGLEVLDAVQANHPRIPVVIVTGTGSEEAAVEAMKRGAADYVIKTIQHIQRLPLIIRAALEKRRLQEERERNQQELNRLGAAVEQSAESIVIFDVQGRIQYVNAAFERTTGLRRHEILDEHFDLVLKRKGVPHRLGDIASEIAASEIWTHRWRAQGAEPLQEDASISPIRDHEGRVLNYIAILRDVTKEVELEEQVRLAQKMEAIGLLAGGVAHDFNNLLQIIQGYTSLAKEESANADIGVHLEQVLQAAERASQLTRQLLAFGRNQPLQKTDTDLNEVVATLLKMIRRLIGEHIEISFIPGPELRRVHADASQLEQVLLNLCVNARDAMPSGGRITIETENVVLDEWELKNHPWARPGEYACISVSDSGVGIDPDTLQHIFEPFFTTKPKEKGTGLGLSVVYGIVKQHDGLVQVHSEPGNGSNFKVFLPAAPERDALTEEKPIELPTGGDETILVAEDEPQVRDLARTILERAGYNVLTAADGEEASQLFADHAEQIDLAMLDVMMPKCGGREVYARIRKIKPGVPALFCSGYSGNSLESEFMVGENAHLLQKPYTPEALLLKVRYILNRWRRRRKAMGTNRLAAPTEPGMVLAEATGRKRPRAASRRFPKP